MSERQSPNVVCTPVLLEYDIAGRTVELYVNNTDAAAEGAYIFQEVVLNNEYLRHGIELHSGGLVIDIGAHIGCFGIKALTTAPHSDITYIGVEPCPTTFQTLSHNLLGPQGEGLAGSFFSINPSYEEPIEAQNEAHNRARICAQYPGNVKLFQAAISNQPGSQTITYYPHMPSNSTFKPLEKQQLQSAVTPAHYFAAAQQVVVPVMTVEQLLQSAGVTGCQVNLLKIDVEGQESEVLQGIQAETWALVHQVVLEVHDVCDGVTASSTAADPAGETARSSAGTEAFPGRDSPSPPAPDAAVTYKIDAAPKGDGRVSRIARMLASRGFEVVVDCPMKLASNFTLFARRTQSDVCTHP